MVVLQGMQDPHEALGIVRAGIQLRPLEEMLTALRKGSTLRKFGRRGGPKFHHFRLSDDDTELQWASSKGVVRRIALRRVLKVQAGQVTPVFRRHPLPDWSHLSFSLIYK